VVGRNACNIIVIAHSLRERGGEQRGLERKLHTPRLSYGLTPLHCSDVVEIDSICRIPIWR